METSLSDFIATSAWGARLSPAELDRVLDSAREVRLSRDEAAVRAGEPADKWVGIIDGFVVQSVGNAEGRHAILTVASAGTWFGEGSLMKQVPWGYAIARRETRIAVIPAPTFRWLREHSLPFNQFIAKLLNERLSLYLGLLADERLTDVDTRMAHVLASLFDPELYPGRERTLRMSQADVALLAGMSRQRANAALHKLQEVGLVRIGRTDLTVLDVEGLRGY